MKIDEVKESLPKDSNMLMIFTMLFAGILFGVFILIGNELLGTNNFNNLNLRDLITPSDKSGNIQIIGFTLLICLLCYGIGFVLYCLSLPFLALPTYLSLRINIVKPTRVFNILRISKTYNFMCLEAVEYLIETTKNTKLKSALDVVKNYSHQYHLGFIYFYNRTFHQILSSDSKFLFHQVMFARTNLFSLTASLLINIYLYLLQSTNSFLSWETLSLFCIFIGVYFVAILIYRFTLIFQDKALYNVFIINNILEETKLDKESSSQNTLK